MNKSILALSCLLSAAAVHCTGTADGDETVGAPDSRALVVNNGGQVLYVRLTHALETRSYTVGVYDYFYVPWQVELIQRLAAPATASPPTDLLLAQETGFVSQGVRVELPWGTGDSGRPELHEGGEYVILCGRQTPALLTSGWRLGLYAVNEATHTLAQSALEFPAGTPMTTVMNASTVPSP